MHILILEPFFTGSHAAWAEGYAKHSRHTVDILSLTGSHWKWRMHGGAVTLARKFLESDLAPDLLLATDMLDLTTFLALTRKRTAEIPTAIYFHENQLTYPWSPIDRDVKHNRDRHYAFINFASAIAADRVFFNSNFHRASFLEALPKWLRHFPDHQETRNVDLIKAKSDVLPLGFDFEFFDKAKPDDTSNQRPLILWNHRWEYDKNPKEFFDAIKILDEKRVDFELAILGENTDVEPDEFADARVRFSKRIRHFGFADSRVDYARWLWRSDILPVTSNHDFFGCSVIEAMHCDVVPLLPPRLAYPELIPGDQDCFYVSFDDLVTKLEHALTHIDDVRKTSYRDLTRRFDWNTVASSYDEALVAI